MSDEHTCEGCALANTRRDFIKESFAVAFGALLTLGVSEKAAAASISFVNALGSRAGTMMYAIPSADGAQIDKNNEVIMLRWESDVYAFSLSCPHQHTALRWQPENGRFECPKHHSKYKPDGTYISGRATRSMDRFAIKREGAALAVDTNTMYKQPDDPTGWANAVVRLGGS